MTLTSFVTCSLVITIPYSDDDKYETADMTWANASLYVAKQMMHLSTEDLPKSSMTWAEVFLIICQIFVNVNGYLKDWFGELFVFCGFTSLWLLLRDFKTRVEDVADNLVNNRNMNSYSKSMIKTSYRQYKKLKLTSKLVKGIYGVVFIPYILTTLVYFPTRINLLFANRNEYPLERVIIFVHFPVEIILMFLCADITAKVNQTLHFTFKLFINCP